MADEPTGNLDSVNGAHVLELLIKLNQRERTTLVLVTHDITLASRADRIVTLTDGRIVGDEVREHAGSSPSGAGSEHTSAERK
jgi:putative ABC transport system ATP-binding protein